MLTRRFLKIGTTTLALLASASANAAMVSNVQGQVLVDAGQGAKPVIGAQSLQVGETVIVEKGSAQLIYPDGCTFQVETGSTTKIEQQSPCAVQAGNAQIQTGQIPPATSAGLGGFSTTGLLIGGAAVIGGAVVLSSQGSKSNRPASP